MLSIIIVNAGIDTWDTLTSKAVEGIKKWATGEYELIVVDNGGLNRGQVNTNDMVSYGIAVNKGVESAKGDRFLILNNDIIVNGNFMQCLGKGEFEGPTVKVNKIRIEYLEGWAISITKELWNKLGGFDEEFINSWDDVDLSWRITQKLRIPITKIDNFPVEHIGFQTRIKYHTGKDEDFCEQLFRNKHFEGKPKEFKALPEFENGYIFKPTNKSITDIEGKTFVIVNTAGFGDILATTCAIHHLKELGAKIIFGTRLKTNTGSIFSNDEACEYVFHIERYKGNQTIIDEKAVEYCHKADYCIDQSFYIDDSPYSFYEARLKQVGIDPFKFNKHEIKGYLYTNNGNKIESAKFLQGKGLLRYMVLHYGSTSPRRRWNDKAAKELVNRLPFPVIHIYSSKFNETPLNCLNCTSLDGDTMSFGTIVEICNSSKLMITTDSLFSHVALALKKDVVSIYSGEVTTHMRIGQHHPRQFELPQPYLSEEMMNVKATDVDSLVRKALR